MNIPDAAIEAAAEAMDARAVQSNLYWRGGEPTDYATAALEAAMPAIREHIAQGLPFAHMPGCKCETEGAPDNNERDQTCIEWTEIVKRFVRGGTE